MRPLVIRTVPHLQDRHIRDRRKFAEKMLARLAVASGKAHLEEDRKEPTAGFGRELLQSLTKMASRSLFYTFFRRTQE